MKKILLFIFALVIFIIIGLIFAPVFINLNNYKDNIASRFEEIIGTKPSIDGNIEVRFFPTPHIKLSEVNIKNNNQATGTYFISVKNIDIQASYISLFQEGLVIKEITLVSPVIDLETADDMESNWEGFLKNFRAKNDKQNLPKNIHVKNGYLVYRNNKVVKHTLDYINADIKALENDKIQLTAMFEKDGNQMELYFTDVSDKDNNMTANITSESFSAGMEGIYINDSDIEGTVNLSINNLAAFGDSFLVNNILFKDINSTESLSIRGKFVKNDKSFKLDDIKIESQNIKGVASIERYFGRDKSWNIQTALSEVNIDNLSYDKESEVIEDESTNYYDYISKDSPQQNYFIDIPIDLRLLAAVNIEKIIYKKEEIRDVIINLDVFDGNSLINEISAKLPGDANILFTGNVETNGIRPQLKGKVKSVGLKFRDVLAWINPDYNFVPEDELQEYLFTFDINATPQRVDIININFSVDQLLLTGDFEILPSSEIPSITGELNLEKVNFDKYNFTSYADRKIRNFIKSIQDIKLSSSYLNNLNYVGVFTFNLNDIIYNDHNIKNIILSYSITPGILNLNRFILSGDKVSMVSKVKINLTTSTPQFSFALKSPGLDTSAFILDEKNQTPEPDSEKLVDASVVSVQEKFNFLGIERFAGRASIQIDHLRHKDVMFSDVKLEGEVENKIVKLDVIEAGLDNGKIETNFNLGLRDQPIIAASFKLTNIDIARFNNFFESDFNHYFDNQAKIYLAGTIKTGGFTADDWINRADGNFKVNLRNYNIEEFGLDKIIVGAQKLYSVIDLQKIISEAMNSGNSLFTEVEGNVNIKDSILKLDNLNFKTGYAAGMFASNIDMKSFNSSSIAKFIFAPEYNKRVSLDVTLKGPLGDMKHEVNSTELENYITGKSR